MSKELPDELQHLKNLIEDAESDTSIKVLRRVLKSAINLAPRSVILRMSKFLLKEGIDLEKGKRN